MEESGQEGVHSRHCLHLDASHVGILLRHSPVMVSRELPPS